MAKTKGNIHSGHRRRMREKILNGSAEGFAEHELIEMLLYYSIPRRNTNELAHTLEKEFGGIVGILNADSDHLLSIDGVGDTTVATVKFIRECVHKYVNEANNISNVRLTPGNIGVYIKNLFFGHTREMLYAILLDKDCTVKKVRKISTGTVNATPLYPREIVQFAVNEKYPYLVLAHNHPNGDPNPSQEDIDITKTVEMALSFIEVRLVDHVIVAGERVVSIARDLKVIQD